MIKRLAITLGILAALLLVALALIALLFNPNDYKDKIAALARDATGRELTLVDDMKLSLFPWLGVEFGRVEFANAAGFGPQPFARVAAARVKVRLLPLLQRRIEIGTITLQGLEVSLETAADGRTNWDDLTARGTAQEGADKEPAPPSDGSEAALALPATLSIGGLDVRDGALHWRDDAGGTRVDIGALRLASGHIESGQPVDLQFGFDLHGAAPALEGRFELAARVTAEPARQRVQAERLQLKAALSGPALPVPRLDLDLQGAVAADLAQQTLDLPQLSLALAGLTLQGRLGVTQLREAPHLSGHLESAAFNPRELLQALGKPAPQTADAAALTRAAFGFDLTADGEGAKVTALKLQLDDSALTGTASVHDFAAPALRFDLALDRIDLDRYLAPAQSPAAATPAAAAPAAAQLPLDTLRALDLDGRLAAGQLRVSGLTLSDLHATVRAKDGLIALAPLGASLYGGRYAGNIRLDARGAAPAFAFDESLTGIQAAPLLKDLFDNDTFSGTADFALAATAAGDGEEALLRSLRGQARIGLHDGAVKGFNAAQMIRAAKAKLEGATPPAATVNQTDFSALTATLRFDGGSARNDDLQASSPYLRVGGDGQADLLGRTLDYRLRVKLVGSEIGQGGEAAGSLRGIEIPLRIAGPFAAPTVALDSAIIRDALKQKAKAAVKEAVDANKAQLQEKAGQKSQQLRHDAEEKLKNKLKGLLQ